MFERGDTQSMGETPSLLGVLLPQLRLPGSVAGTTSVCLELIRSSCPTEDVKVTVAEALTLEIFRRNHHWSLRLLSDSFVLPLTS